jgi:hypothetical protein
MNKKNPSHEKKHINKVEEPIEAYQVKTYLDVSVIGYDEKGNAINKNEFIDDIEQALLEIKSGKLKMKSVSEIRK